MGFERCKLLADCRLADIGLARNRRQASRFDDAGKQLHRIKSVHGSMPRWDIMNAT
jgi:hypothetical protein